jgi:hypothetical protein
VKVSAFRSVRDELEKGKYVSAVDSYLFALCLLSMRVPNTGGPDVRPNKLFADRGAASQVYLP